MSETETPLSHSEAARQLVESLRSLQSGIAGFAIPPSPLEPQVRPRGHRVLPNGFFESLAFALESSPQLAASTKLKPADIRDMLRYCEAYLPVADELERFARGIRYGVALRRGKIGRVASAAYRIAKSLNLLVDVDLPVPEVESMKRAIVDRRRKGSKLPPVGTAAVKSSP